MIGAVARRAFQLAAAVVLLLGALTPLAEAFDHWDRSNTVPANDTELRLTAWFVMAGCVLTLNKLVQRRPAPAGAAISVWRKMLAPCRQLEAPLDAPEHTGSPPLTSLRI